MQDSLTFACVLFDGKLGDVKPSSTDVFTPEWADRLYRAVKRNTTRDVRFVCFCDKPYEFAEPIESRLLELGQRNNLALLEPFREDLGRVVFAGLDTVITGNIDVLWDIPGKFAMLQDPWRSRPCSGVMVYDYSPHIWAAVRENLSLWLAQAASHNTWVNDQLLLAQYEPDVFDGPSMGVYSYKAHIKAEPELADDARVIYFHGREKPHEIDEPWLHEHWI